jgi:hypothetical protein
VSPTPRPAQRPRKKAEYRIEFASRLAEKGWQDLLATTRSGVVDAWDFLTRTPLQSSTRNHPLRGELATVVRDGRTHDRWQHELSGGAGIWFYVDANTVRLVDVFTAHPNQTK